MMMMMFMYEVMRLCTNVYKIFSLCVSYSPLLLIERKVGATVAVLCFIYKADGENNNTGGGGGGGGAYAFPLG